MIILLTDEIMESEPPPPKNRSFSSVKRLLSRTILGGCLEVNLKGVTSFRTQSRTYQVRVEVTNYLGDTGVILCYFGRSRNKKDTRLAL